MFASNELLNFLSAPPLPPRPQLINPFVLPLSPNNLQNSMLLLQPSFQQLLLNSLTNSQFASSQLISQLQFQLLGQQPGFLDLLSQSFGAKKAEVHEVPNERNEKIQEEKIVPEPVIAAAPSVTVSRKRTASSSPTQLPPKKSKALRRLHNADVETNSPVSGMFIKDASEVSADDLSKSYDLDETASCVEITEESKRKIAAIPNVIGKSKCSLCKREFPDVFRLAMHRCPRIIHAEYKCPECSKVFSCPANLASHRRWHQPRNMTANCSNCCQSFDTKKLLREHKCPLKLIVSASSRNSITSIVTDSSPNTSSVESPTEMSASVSPSNASVHSPQPALISLGLNTNSLQVADLRPHLNFNFTSAE